MAHTLTIAPLQDQDRDELIKLVNSAYRGESSKKGWTTEADLLGGIRTDHNSVNDMLKEAGSLFLVAKTDAGKMIGCVYLHQQGAQMYLGMLSVDPDSQALGIGKQLLLASENHARKLNCQSIVMSVIDVRRELIAWYQRKGYRETGEIKPFPTDPAFGIPKQPLQFTMLEKTLTTAEAGSGI